MAANEFWEYSLALYQRPGVAEFCLRLQDGIGASGDAVTKAETENRGDRSETANVNLLLFCCWAGSRGVKLSDAEVMALEAEIALWHTGQVLPLRAERRAPGIAQQRKRELLERELAAERIEQDQLFNWFQDRHSGCSLPTENLDHSVVADSIRHNLNRYLSIREAACADREPTSRSLYEGNPLQREAERYASWRGEN